MWLSKGGPSPRFLWKRYLYVAGLFLLLVVISIPSSNASSDNGNKSPSCIFAAESGALVFANGTIVNPDSTRLQINHNCVKSQATPPTTNGWVEDANWLSSSSVQTAWAYWTVPNGTPQGCSWYGSTLIYMFNALEDGGDGNSIIQPVLQFGWNGYFSGGCYWMIASWFGENGYYTHSGYISASPGDQVYGYMHYIGNTQNGCCWWYIQTSDVTTSKSTTMQIQDPTHSGSYHWAFGGALEAYNINNCNQYPGGNGGWTYFTDVELHDANYKLLTPSWANSVNSVTPSCMFAVFSWTHQVVLDY